MLRSVRLILAGILTLAAAGILYWGHADEIPHDASARVSPEEFWQALARSDPARRPAEILVYPPQRGVQLVRCVGHPQGGSRGASKYLYISTPNGKPTVEEQLTRVGAPFRTPWQYSNWVLIGPWIAFSIASSLVVLPRAVGFVKTSLALKPRKPIFEPTTAPTPADLQRLRELDAEMERGLCATDPTSGVSQSRSEAVEAPVALNGGPLVETEKPPEEKKDYLGEFYPVAKRQQKGFSLLELLVVIGILGLLIALLLPAIAGARRDANQIACAANLRSINQGLLMYENENNGCIPASYSYIGQTVVNGEQTYTAPAYTHWSYFLYHSGSIPISAFLCPELERGGLPPTNTTPDNRDPGQIGEVPPVIDQQPPRLAYTLNEALSPRNKFAGGFQSAVRLYQFIKASSIPHSSRTVLATEWGPTAARSSYEVGANRFYIYSHRPVHGFVGLDGTLEMHVLSQSVPYRRVNAADLDPDPSTASSYHTLLDWVGRNHGRSISYPNERRSNFLYLDGHVECKSIYDTLEPFEWGETFFTLTPNGDLQ